MRRDDNDDGVEVIVTINARFKIAKGAKSVVFVCCKAGVGPNADWWRDNWEEEEEKARISGVCV